MLTTQIADQEIIDDHFVDAVADGMDKSPSPQDIYHCERDVLKNDEPCSHVSVWAPSYLSVLLGYETCMSD